MVLKSCLRQPKNKKKRSLPRRNARAHELTSETYKPFIKPNSNFLFVQPQLNHLPELLNFILIGLVRI